MDTSTPTEAAERLLDRLRDFAVTLDDQERALFAALIAPGVAQAYPDVDDDVVGFAARDEVGWSPRALPASLGAAVRRRGVRVVGLGD